ncbi:hypothetical protein FQN60_006228 [Etheostoma spectabile]|uniref:Uncharacterized protein n=1 Tax=Etheostoma spectabile TaxID=54343 RepID=A0A5J5CLH5_9PERO|nr:hypothetical protein FQN60_006228 [Etheostoma spectabile]
MWITPGPNTLKEQISVDFTCTGYLNPHHYPQPGSSEVVVNYDLQSVIIIKLGSAEASLKTPAGSKCSARPFSVIAALCR